VAALRRLGGLPAGRLLPRRLRRRLRVLRFRTALWVFRHHCGLALLRNLWEDRRYGGWSGGNQQSAHTREGANLFGSAHYYELDRIFTAGNGLAIAADDVLVDVGCGKGRVLNWWLGRGLDNQIVGLELDQGLARVAAERLRRHPNVAIRTGNAIDNLPADGTLFWLFNPFTANAAGRQLMQALSERLLNGYTRESSLRVGLYRPRHVEVFTDDSRWQVRMLPKNRLFYRVALATPASAAGSPTASAALRAAMSTGSHTGENGGA